MKIKLNIFYGNLLKVSTNHYTFVNCLSRSIENSAEHILRYRSSQDISSKFACGFLCINTTCSFKHLNNSFGASDFKYLIKWVYFNISRLSFNCDFLQLEGIQYYIVINMLTWPALWLPSGSSRFTISANLGNLTSSRMTRGPFTPDTVL